MRAIVAGHGDFAAGMISAVQAITGRDDVFEAMSNQDLSAVEVERDMRERLDATTARVIFCDLPAGSCTMAARRLQRERPELTVVTGVNLTTLLDFVFNAEVAPAEAARHAAERGRSSLLSTGASK